MLCLHEWGAHEHPSLMSPDHAQPGNGLLLFFRVDDFDMALPRARALVARLEEEPHVNPNTGTTEFSLRDPDGYYVTISALSAAYLLCTIFVARLTVGALCYVPHMKRSVSTSNPSLNRTPAGGLSPARRSPVSLLR